MHHWLFYLLLRSLATGAVEGVWWVRVTDREGKKKSPTKLQQKVAVCGRGMEV